MTRIRIFESLSGLSVWRHRHSSTLTLTDTISEEELAGRRSAVTRALAFLWPLARIYSVTTELVSVRRRRVWPRPRRDTRSRHYFLAVPYYSVPCAAASLTFCGPFANFGGLSGSFWKQAGYNSSFYVLPNFHILYYYKKYEGYYDYLQTVGVILINSWLWNNNTV